MERTHLFGFELLWPVRVWVVGYVVIAAYQASSLLIPIAVDVYVNQLLYS